MGYNVLCSLDDYKSNECFFKDSKLLGNSIDFLVLRKLSYCFLRPIAFDIELNSLILLI